MAVRITTTAVFISPRAVYRRMAPGEGADAVGDEGVVAEGREERPSEVVQLTNLCSSSKRNATSR
jgi:hypothetical protein